MTALAWGGPGIRMRAAESDPRIRQELLPAATVRVYVAGDRRGTGFFVGAGTVVTCKHVLKPLDLEDEAAVDLIRVTGLDERHEYKVKRVRHVSPDDDEDLAVLRVEPGNSHPCVLLE